MLLNLPVTTPDLAKPIVTIVQKVESTKPIEYVVQDNDNLTKIATAQNTNIERLWEKNTQLANPDVLKPGDKLTIPKAEEVLVDRPMPEPAILTPQPTTLPSAGGVSSSGGSSHPVIPGNTYSAGYCTWYAKNQRPDIPNNLGNADTWYTRAAAQGFAVGASPRVGAVAAAVGYMHVAIVTAVLPNGKIQVSEMNYKGFGVVSSRTAPVSEFHYIY